MVPQLFVKGEGEEDEVGGEKEKDCEEEGIEKKKFVGMFVLEGVDNSVPWKFNRLDGSRKKDAEKAAEKIDEIVPAAETFQSERHTEIGKENRNCKPKSMVDVAQGKRFVKDSLDGDALAENP